MGIPSKGERDLEQNLLTQRTHKGKGTEGGNPCLIMKEDISDTLKEEDISNAQ